MYMSICHANTVNLNQSRWEFDYSLSFSWWFGHIQFS